MEFFLYLDQCYLSPGDDTDYHTHKPSEWYLRWIGLRYFTRINVLSGPVATSEGYEYKVTSQDYNYLWTKRLRWKRK